MKKRRSNLTAALTAVIMAILVTGGAALIILPDEQKQPLLAMTAAIRLKLTDFFVAHGLTSCRIKGNVSINTGEKIFHVPGQEDYFRTRINTRYGERWFCTEAEARAAGWRKAGR